MSVLVTKTAFSVLRTNILPALYVPHLLTMSKPDLYRRGNRTNHGNWSKVAEGSEYDLDAEGYVILSDYYFPLQGSIVPYS
jgi:hypothetical protein